MVFQNYALFPHMTVSGNLAFRWRCAGSTARSAASAWRVPCAWCALAAWKTGALGNSRAGSNKRVAIARALVFEPDLVLMDEPLGALDRRLREEMQYEIRRIHKSLGVTVVYVTHDQQEAMVLSDRIAVLRGGDIEQIAEPEALYEEPKRSFVARFIGENNRLHGWGEKSWGRHLRSGNRRSGHSSVARRALPARRFHHAFNSSRARRHRARSRPIHQRIRRKNRGHHFLGDHLRLRLTVCDRSDFIAKIPNIVGHAPS